MRSDENALTHAISRVADPIIDSIKRHPFLEGIQDGTLPKQTFSRFVVQDALFLDEFARSLALFAARSPLLDDLIVFCEGAARVIKVERMAHSDVLPQLGLDERALPETERTPTCAAYCSFLKDVCATHDHADGLAALLPCISIYWEVGKHLSVTGSPDRFYQDWIDMYLDDEYVAFARATLEACDRVGADLGRPSRDEMVRIAWLATRYEWMFWDSAYRDERWPI